MIMGYDGMKSGFKNKYPMYQNITGGIPYILCGTGIIVVYTD